MLAELPQIFLKMHFFSQRITSQCRVVFRIQSNIYDGAFSRTLSNIWDGDFSENSYQQKVGNYLQRCSVEKMFLKISQNSKKNNCVGVRSLGLQLIKKEATTKVFYCEFCEISNGTLFHRTPSVTISACSFLTHFWPMSPFSTL